MIIIRLIQGVFIGDVSSHELKWLLLGEWLNQGFEMYRETFDYTGPIAVLIYKYLNLIIGRSAFMHYGFSSLIIIFQAGIFNHILLKNKAYDENSYLPAFLYMILMVSVPDFMTLSPQLLSLTFVLLSLQNVLRRIDNQVTDELFLNSGIYLGIASMIYLPSMVFFLVFLFSLIVFSTAVTRRILLYLFSFLLAFALCALYFYWRGDLLLFVDRYLVQNLLLYSEYQFSLREMILIGGAFAVIFILGVFKTIGSARLTNFQQKIQQVIWLMFLGAIATFFLSNEKSVHEMVFLIPIIAYFWTHYFILLRRRIFRFLMPGILVFGCLAYSIFLYSKYMVPMTVKPVLETNENTMVFSHDLDYYLEAKVLSPCFNDQMTINAFEGLAYYQSAVVLFQLFEKANPDWIIDELNVIPPFFNRFPSVATKYKSLGNGRYQKISN